ncbi:lasso peptide biosynthesis B2 protein [Siminovitchia acidinfaciens]|uniref:Lasso peptide biosynthesis B2 protein n=1 Tax=Siminovitchia acidinfaciens TaxID=2321395 RepID=A0A429XVY8_9BACI|nr:lasso peptide biosynthesis B2 protein [Siminovitchia acidinfaciens]RST72537.1 lasso peptide biosynthesis B2 protein [Siminovitchia acidinfaciens]
MQVKSKINTLISLKPKTIFLLLEAYLYLGWARLLKIIPFSKVAPSLGEHMEETPNHVKAEHTAVIKNISHALHIMGKYTFWESQCLVKAVAGMKMLEKRGIDSTLYLGTARDESGQMVAHAWLRSGPFYLSGAEGMEKFTTVGMFAKKVGAHHGKGGSYE